MEYFSKGDEIVAVDELLFPVCKYVYIVIAV